MPGLASFDFSTCSNHPTNRDEVWSHSGRQAETRGMPHKKPAVLLGMKRSWICLRRVLVDQEEPLETEVHIAKPPIAHICSEMYKRAWKRMSP